MLMKTVDQDGLEPTQKVTFATAGGAAGVVVVFVAGQFGLDMSPEVSGAVVTLLAFVGGYFKREKKEN